MVLLHDNRFITVVLELSLYYILMSNDHEKNKLQEGIDIYNHGGHKPWHLKFECT